MDQMYYSNLKPHDVANGAGVRVSLFVSGCEHACPGCFNPAAWQFNFGQPYTAQTEQQIIDALQPDYIRGLTLLGGEPLHPRNRDTVYALIDRIRCELPKKDIWCYTGFVFEHELLPDPDVHPLLQQIDVLVDGRFVQAHKSFDTRFRGSSNQRMLQCRESIAAGRAVLWDNA